MRCCSALFLFRPLDPTVQLPYPRQSAELVAPRRPSVSSDPSQRARAPPGLERGSINTASVGTGNATHVSGELFEMAIGVDTVHVPYRDLPYSNPITLPLVEKELQQRHNLNCPA